MKKNLPIIFAISLPIIFVMILAISVTFTKSKVNLEYDFVYTFQGDIYSYENSYILVDGKINYFKNNFGENEFMIKREKAPLLYLYSSETNSYREISIEEANKLDLIAGQISPDGYTLKEVNDRITGFSELFFGSYDSGFVITKDGNSKRINITDEYYYQLPTILGWIK